MGRYIVNLLLLLFLISATISAPAEDEVHIPLGGYHEHKWYSGIVGNM